MKKFRLRMSLKILAIIDIIFEDRFELTIYDDSEPYKIKTRTRYSKSDVINNY